MGRKLRNIVWLKRDLRTQDHIGFVRSGAGRYSLPHSVHI